MCWLSPSAGKLREEKRGVVMSRVMTAFARRIAGGSAMAAVIGLSLGLAAPCAAAAAPAGVPNPPQTCIAPLLKDLPLPAATVYDHLTKAEQRAFNQALWVRLGGNPTAIAGFIAQQDLSKKQGFGAALIAFAGLRADAIAGFALDNAALLQTLSLAVQAHQDWYESLTTRVTEKLKGKVEVVRATPRIVFSKVQLSAMRVAFRGGDGLITNGALLLAYPDRLERNEAVTAQYRALSAGMTGIVGGDNGSWGTVAVWASDIIGRNVSGNLLLVSAEALGSNPRYWLSVGNSQLVSDIGVGFGYFELVFGNGHNRNLDFESYWAQFSNAYRGRNISYIDGIGDPLLRMKTAFSAYYAAMQLYDQANATSDPAQRAALDARRAEIVLFADAFVALQEQTVIQPVLDYGMCALGIVDPFGMDAAGVDFIIPGANGSGQLVIPTSRDLANTPFRVNLDQTFTLLDGQTVQMNTYMRDTLNSLTGDIPGVDEYDPANSGTHHWEQYGQRMGFIFQLFSDYQQYAPLFEDPRAVFGTRAKPLNNDPTLALYQTQ
jgi:hypothetical protein